MKIKFLGHACFLLDDGAHKVLTDPFLTGNGLAAAKAEEVEADFLFVTHGHSDHTGDAAEIAKRTGAPVCCTVDLADAVFGPAGLSVMVGNIGGRIPTAFGSAKMVSAIHGSGVPGGLACGFVFDMGGKRIYHAGDTALTSDMAFLAEENIDVALLPIGDLFTMGPKDALRAVEMIKPKLVIPMHYNTFPPITQDADAFVEQVRKLGVEARALKPGEELEV
ncbi:MAG: metal-dependent hydrolase [Lachnospiraceae bacterium]|nr:metal-dependent hydrolase [Lachnospiraceae bacterium]